MTEINWAKWGSIAEVFGSIAIVITLLALLFEIQSNSELTRVSAYQSEISKISAWRADISSDPIKSRLFTAFLNNGDLPDEGSVDELILRMTVQNLWAIYESSYVANLAGIIEGNEWERMRSNMCNQLNTLSDPDFKKELYRRLSTNFTTFVESNCVLE